MYILLNGFIFQDLPVKTKQFRIKLQCFYFLPFSLSKPPQHRRLAIVQKNIYLFFHLNIFVHKISCLAYIYLLYYVGEGVRYDCDHDDDCYQQNYTSGADLFDILSKNYNQKKKSCFFDFEIFQKAIYFQKLSYENQNQRVEVIIII